MKKYKFEILLILLIVVQLIVITYCFATKKVGYHSDEIWSYGLANSYEGAHIFKDSDDNYINNNEWIPGKVLYEYITVDEDTRFAYGHVVDNLKDDTHPPLYFIILHTICSLFPGEFSKWFAYVINMVAFVLCMIGLYMFGKKLIKSKLASLILCLFYGFSLASLNTYMFLRMYALTTAVTIFTVYIHYNIYCEEDGKVDKSYIKNMIAVACLTLVGALLVHIYLTFAFFLSTFTCLILLCRKRIKQLFIYIGTMLGSVGLSIIMFPATISHLFSVAGSELTNYNIPLWLDIKCAFFYYIRELFGVIVEVKPSYLDIYFFELFLVFLVIGVPFFFVFRKEKWMHTFFMKIKTFTGKIPALISRINWFVVALIVTVYMDIVIIANNIDIMKMNNLSDRYVVNIYPVIYAVVMYLLYSIMLFCTNKINNVKGKNIINRQYAGCISMIFLMLAIYVLTYSKSGCYYYFEQDEKMSTVLLNDISHDADVLISLKEYWLMTCLSYDIKDCNSFFACTLEELIDLKEEIDTYSGTRPKYWITELPKHNEKLEEVSVLEDIISVGSEINMVNSPDNPLIAEKMDVLTGYLKTTSFANDLTFIGHSYIFGRTVLVYRVN